MNETRISEYENDDRTIKTYLPPSTTTTFFFGLVEKARACLKAAREKDIFYSRIAMVEEVQRKKKNG